MLYDSLDTLIKNSRSSRRFFLSLPVSMQCILHRYNLFIHSQEELRSMVYGLEKSEINDCLGGWRQNS